MDTNKKNFKISVLQIKTHLLKKDILKEAQAALEEAIKNGVNICIYGECFNTPFRKDYLTENAENFSESGEKTPTLNMLKELSKKYGVYILGSIPEVDDNNKLYNTGFCFGKDGSLIAKHRKVHLFDIDIKGKITYKESETISAGDSVTVFDTEYCKIGLAICYDIRFAEFSLLMAKKGAQLLVFPAQFNLTTGPLHWELLLKSRAIDNQVYVVGASGSRFIQDTSVYQSWGHSTICDPFGKILATTEHSPDIIYADIDLNYIDEVREQIPLYKQKRLDIYEIIDKKN